MSLYVMNRMPSVRARGHLGGMRKQHEENAQGQVANLRRRGTSAEDRVSQLGARIQSEIRGLEQARRNASDGITAVQTAEDSMRRMEETLGSMKQLALRASSTVLVDNERRDLDRNFQQRMGELEGIAKTTLFQGRPLLTGTESGVSFQIGVGPDADQITLSIADMRPGQLGARSGAPLGGQSISSFASARRSIETIDQAVKTVAGQRASLRKVQEALNNTINSLGARIEDLSSSSGERIHDRHGALQILDQVQDLIDGRPGSSVLSQANQNPHFIASLLAG